MDISREEVVVSALGSLIAENLVGHEDFNQAEGFALEKGMELLRDAFALALEAFDQTLLDEADARFKVKSKDERTLLTCFGEVRLRRRRFSSEVGSVYLLDEALSLVACERATPTLSAIVSTLATDCAYQKAADGLAAYIGVGKSATFVKRSLAKSAEVLFESELAAKRRRVPALDVEADGVYVHLQRTKAAKAADKKAGKSRRRAYTEIGVYVAYEGKKVCGKNKKERINCLHLATAKPTPDAWEEFRQMIDKKWEADSLYYVNLATDGGPGYVAGEKYLPGKVTSGYDLRHITSALSPAFGRDIAAEAFAMMKRYGFDEGFQLLCDYRDWFESQDGKDTYRKATDALAAQAKRIKTALSYNLGTIEATNAHLIGSRMKRFGGGWSSGIEPMARLRAHRAGGQAIPCASRKPCVCLPDRIRARSLAQAEDAIALLETKARGLKWQKDNLDNKPLYYHQASVAHAKADQACHSYLHLWR